MSVILNPHDRYFKETFARPEIARDFLKNYLPEAIRARLDLSTLALEKESFVDPDLRQHFSDLLYQVETVEETPSYVYLLFEHKSYPDPLTVFQMLRYCVRIWEQALRADDSLTELPPIIPLLVYHGERAWNAPMDMIELLAGDEALHAYGPRFSCRLLDLSRWSAEEIKESVLQVVLQAMHSVRDPRLGRMLLPRMLSVLLELTEERSGVEYIQVLLVYLSAASPYLTEEEMQEALQETLSRKGESIMPTLAEKWYQQGIEQGRAEVREGVMRTLLGLLEHRFAPLDPELITQIETLTVDQLQSLSLSVLDAESISQVTEQVYQLRS